ncbi:hypothetical protein [Gordonia sp. ABSL49_1]|uniref:hypothetical protein n=1 Tax=Gordonia sp. ABSL49_1 TaxID=2920941 RepID=UPI001F0DA4F1|nr:hypothetical protein [Gordonia sp. ABSL49_1]MCH5644154.1 hypothetical protein [Gordonia sp. ABSL49_1]
MPELPNLASTDRLGARLGITFEPDSADYARAKDALWSVSVRARSITGRDYPDPEHVPDPVVDVVLSAAMRLYRNPDRFLTNQAGSFQATLSAADFAAGDIFLSAEVAVLEKHKAQPRNLWTAQMTREDGPGVTEPERPTSYVSDPTNLGLGDPFYVGDAWGNGPW